MNEELYEMIFKRKSFHLFRNIGKEHITDKELEELENMFYKFQPLVKNIKVKSFIFINSIIFAIIFNHNQL